MEREVTFESAAFWKNPGCMSESRAAELAAQQVESILQAAESAAEQIKKEAREEVAAATAGARQRAADLEQRARDQALEFDEDTRREAERLLEDAQRRATQIREQTKRSVAGRVDRAEAAANEMVGHAEALSEGLLKLGELLTEQGERILRDVRTARREMRANLTAAIEGDGAAPAANGEPAEEESTPPLRRNGERSRRFMRETDGAKEDELEPPSWVESG
jgi:vacuolar-type H+-ATPase subunit E/Vma4